ncbi:hypothetical protein EXM63_03655 [Clostridium botulinum]|uniref:Uncharacterized protein n=1 Tax=Clostridium botulinum TaxID=1491 RepID=A0A6M0SVG7_CLOBO|nr:hypothetical protein [Clostridium botulinum]NFI74711.1 hypothetical protein [Clostridium sporogenes]NFL71155.1 hypothetical protein [Clostridium sporogenes]NFM24967.1 hypothetical protein [Clostridium sporogenes]NFP62428.1 hypothetical protein [Clostridium sporogenes]
MNILGREKVSLKTNLKRAVEGGITVVMIKLNGTQKT